jgi:nitrite reductase/ring-hydroxylating ferredoxin subunit
MVDQDRDYLSKSPDGEPHVEQPQWRQDFPIDVPQDNYVSRREFTKFLVLISGAFAVGQAWIVWENWRRTRRGDLPVRAIATLDKVPVGGSLVFHYPNENEPCLLVRTDESTLLAYSQKCTHLSCAVIPEVEKNCFTCPCHHGYFAMNDGRVLAGPPQRPLPRVTLEVRGDTIYATGVELRTVA